MKAVNLSFPEKCHREKSLRKKSLPEINPSENCPPENYPPQICSPRKIAPQNTASQENSPRKNCFIVDIILQLFIVSSFRGVSRTPEISIMDLLVTLVNGII